MIFLIFAYSEGRGQPASCIVSCGSHHNQLDRTLALKKIIIPPSTEMNVPNSLAGKIVSVNITFVATRSDELSNANLIRQFMLVFTIDWMIEL